MEVIDVLQITEITENVHSAQQVWEWASRVASPTEVTIYVRHIPSDCTKAEFEGLIARAGYAGEYDYMYLPRCFHTRMCKGYAFINLLTTESARGLTQALHGLPMGRGCVLSVSRSTTQGLADNIVKWARARSRRVKDPEVLPSVRIFKTKEVLPSVRLFKTEEASSKNPNELEFNGPADIEVPAPFRRSRSTSTAGSAGATTMPISASASLSSSALAGGGGARLYPGLITTGIKLDLREFVVLERYSL